MTGLGGRFGLEVDRPPCQPLRMSNREIATDIIGRMEDDASLYEIARRIEFVAAVREGLADLERGDVVPLEQIKRELRGWITE